MPYKEDSRIRPDFQLLHLRPIAVVASLLVLSQLAIGVPSLVNGAPVALPSTVQLEAPATGARSPWPIMQELTDTEVLQIFSQVSVGTKPVSDVWPIIMKIAQASSTSRSRDFSHPLTASQLTRAILLEDPSSTRRLFSEVGVDLVAAQSVCVGKSSRAPVELAAYLTNVANDSGPISVDMQRSIRALPAPRGYSETEANVRTAMRILAGACIAFYLESGAVHGPDSATS